MKNGIIGKKWKKNHLKNWKIGRETENNAWIWNLQKNNDSQKKRDML